MSTEARPGAFGAGRAGRVPARALYIYSMEAQHKVPARALYALYAALFMLRKRALYAELPYAELLYLTTRRKVDALHPRRTPPHPLLRRR